MALAWCAASGGSVAVSTTGASLSFRSPPRGVCPSPPRALLRSCAFESRFDGVGAAGSGATRCASSSRGVSSTDTPIAVSARCASDASPFRMDSRTWRMSASWPTISCSASSSLTGEPAAASRVARCASDAALADFS